MVAKHIHLWLNDQPSGPTIHFGIRFWIGAGGYGFSCGDRYRIHLQALLPSPASDLRPEIAANPKCRVFFAAGYKIMRFRGAYNVLPVDDPVRKLCEKHGIPV